MISNTKSYTEKDHPSDITYAKAEGWQHQQRKAIKD